MDFTKVSQIFLLKYFSANFKSHLLLDDFVLLGVLCEAFCCTFQVPEVNQPVQSAPDDNTWWSSTSAILNISALRVQNLEKIIKRLFSLGHNTPLSHHGKRVHNWILSIVLQTSDIWHCPQMQAWHWFLIFWKGTFSDSGRRKSTIIGLYLLPWSFT